MDQAKTLRQLLGQAPWCLQPVLGDADCLEVSLLAAQLLDLAAEQGSGGLVIDGSRDVLVEHLNLKKRYELHHYLSGDVGSEAVVLQWSAHAAVLPAHRGLSALSGQQVVNRHRLGQLLSRHLNACDEVYLSLGFSQWSLAADLALDAPQWLWVVQPNRTSVTECYKAMRHAASRCGNIAHRVWISQARSVAQADEVFAELEQATQRFFAQPLDYLGQYNGLPSARVLRTRNRLEALI